MALTKTEAVDRIEIVGDYKTVLVRWKVTVMDDDTLISETFKRASINCKTPDGSGGWIDTDISSMPDDVQAQANTAWTDEVKSKFVTDMSAVAPTDD